MLVSAKWVRATRGGCLGNKYNRLVRVWDAETELTTENISKYQLEWNIRNSRLVLVFW